MYVYWVLTAMCALLVDYVGWQEWSVCSPSSWKSDIIYITALFSYFRHLLMYIFCVGPYISFLICFVIHLSLPSQSSILKNPNMITMLSPCAIVCTQLPRALSKNCVQQFYLVSDKPLFATVSGLSFPSGCVHLQQTWAPPWIRCCCRYMSK